jgi:hypothetical protein
MAKLTLKKDAVYLYKPSDEERQEVIQAGGYEYPFFLVRIKKLYKDADSGETRVRMQRWQLDKVGMHNNKPYLQKHDNGSINFVESAWGSIASDQDGKVVNTLPCRSGYDNRFVMRVDTTKLTSKKYPARIQTKHYSEVTFRLEMWKGGENFDVDAEDVFGDV